MRKPERSTRVLQSFGKAVMLAEETVPQPMAGDLALTLLFWLMVSSRWQDEQARILCQRHSASSMQQPHSADGILFLTQSCTYLYGAERMAQSGDAIHCALEAFCQTQAEPQRALLLAALRPTRFAIGSPVFPDTGDHARLERLVRAVWRCPVTPLRFKPQIDHGALFQTAIALSGINPSAPTSLAAQTLAQALHPRMGERVFDPCCAGGELLAACGKKAQDGWYNQQPDLLGLDSNADMLAIARMHLLLRGLHGARLHDACLATTMAVQADVVVMSIPDNAEEPQNSVADNASGAPDLRQQACIDAVAQAIGALKPDTGRMGLCMSPAFFASLAGLSLRRLLIERDLLDAVVRLGPQGNREEILLLLHTKRTTGRIALIALIAHGLYEGDPAQALGPHHVENAYEAFRTWPNVGHWHWIAFDQSLLESFSGSDQLLFARMNAV
jgi:hypothetical protein